MQISQADTLYLLIICRMFELTYILLSLLIYCLDCRKISSPAHGYISYKQNTTTYKSTAIYKCAVGYKLFGSVNVECDNTGHWNGTANCTIKGECFKSCGRSELILENFHLGIYEEKHHAFNNHFKQLSIELCYLELGDILSAKIVLVILFVVKEHSQMGICFT